MNADDRDDLPPPATGSGWMGMEDLERYMDLFEAFVDEDASDIFRPQLLDIILHPDKKAHFGVYMDAKLLLEDSFLLGHVTMRYPETMLDYFSKALVNKQEAMLCDPRVLDLLQGRCLCSLQQLMPTGAIILTLGVIRPV